MTEVKTLYGQLPYETTTKMLGDETLERLNFNKTGFDFKGYNSSIPGYICLPVKHSNNLQEKSAQEHELNELGYQRLEEELVEKYFKSSYNGRTMYVISIGDLLKIHHIDI